MVKIKLLAIPEYLKPFWRLYKSLLGDGWFDRVYQTFDELTELPPSLRTYGKDLARLVVEERNIVKKQKFYHALEVFLEYLSAEERSWKEKQNPPLRQGAMFGK